jgi:hypothetical protein
MPCCIVGGILVVLSYLIANWRKYFFAKFAWKHEDIEGEYD